MEKQTKTWGKFWTYAVVSGIMLLGYVLTWYLVEQRRDSDAAAFDRVSKANEEQIWTIRQYVESMPDGYEKNELLDLLSPVYIVRTRAEMDSIRKVGEANPPMNGI